MTITANVRRVDYLGDGETTEYAVPFQFFNIEVYVGGALRTDGAHYFTSQSAPGTEGEVIFLTAVSADVPITIVGATERTQEVDYVNNDDFPAEAHEGALDRLTMIAQEQDGMFSRSLRGPVTSGEQPELAFSENPNTVIHVNADGELELIDEQFLAGEVTNATLAAVQEARDEAVAAAVGAAASRVLSEAAEDAAAASEVATLAAQSAAEAAKDTAVTAKNEAVTAKNASEASASSATASEIAADADADAISAAASAVAAAGSALAASGSEATATTAKDDAVTAKNTAVAAAGTATADAATAVSAKDDAETARDEAVAVIASLDLPTIAPGDAGKALIVNDDEDGYILASAVPKRVGELAWFLGTTAPSYSVIANGASLSRTTYAALWTFVQASGNLAATEGAKQDGQFGPGNGSTTFTIPDLATGGRFIRAKTASATMGSEQADAFQGHWHEYWAYGQIAANGSDRWVPAGSSPANAAGTRLTANNHVRDPISDGGNGTPRTATETRPVNVSLIPIIFYE